MASLNELVVARAVLMLDLLANLGQINESSVWAYRWNLRRTL